MTKAQQQAAIDMVVAVGATIRELHTVPSGHLWAQLMGSMSLEMYNNIIDVLKRVKMVEEKYHELRWIASVNVLTLGFTGTQDDMATRQFKAVQRLLSWLNPDTMHLGDSVGADKECYILATDIGCSTEGHPPTNGKRRAFLDYDVAHTPKDYLARNDDIALAAVDGLIAAPKEWSEVQRSGTWSTVRRARKYGRRIWIVKPDGSVKEEPAAVMGVVPGGLRL